MKIIRNLLPAIMLLLLSNSLPYSAYSGNQSGKVNQPISQHSNDEDPLSAGEHYARVNGVTLHYYVAGKGPVCLVPSPGWGFPVGYLYESLRPFKRYFTMVFYDTRISGKSTGPDDPAKYTSRDFMNDMDSLRVYLKQPKVWLLGHSDGGFQVLNYGVLHNDKLNGIIAVDARAGFDSLYIAEFTRNLEQRRHLAPDLVDYLIGKGQKSFTIHEAMKAGMPFYFHDTSKVRLMPHRIDTALSQKAWDYTSAAGFGSENLFPELHQITVPVLVIVGDDDFICPKTSQADRITKEITSSSEVVIKDAGHLPFIEQPGQFFRECEKWLQKHGVEKKR